MELEYGTNARACHNGKIESCGVKFFFSDNLNHL